MSNEWIEWNGGECPVPTGTPVFVRYRTGGTLGPLPAGEDVPGATRYAGPAFWRHDGVAGDIVAYRLAEPVAQDPIQMVETESALDVQIGGSHYKNMLVQPWEAIDAWFNREQQIGYYVGTAVAYLARVNATGEGKGGVQDIRKAHHTLTKLLENLDASEGRS